MRLSWERVEPGLIRALLTKGYEQRGQLDEVVKVRRASEDVLRRTAEDTLGRPMRSEHMTWAIAVLLDKWVPTMPKQELAIMATWIQQTIAPSQRPELPTKKPDLAGFVQARKRTPNLHNIVRRSFHRLHQVEREIRSGSSEAGPNKSVGYMQGEDARPPYQPAEHQKEAWRGLDRLSEAHLPEERAGLLILPTGAGKTYTAAKWILDEMEKNPETRVLWIADRRELVDQAGRAFDVLARCLAPEFRRRMRVIYSGANTPSTLADPDVDIVFITNFSLWSSSGGADQRSRRLKVFLSRPTIVVVDEAHHATSPTYRELLKFIVKQRPDVMLLGLSATPWPAGKGRAAQLQKTFPKIVANVHINDLVHVGFLAKPILHTIKTESVMRLQEAERKAALNKDIPPEALARLNNDQRNELLVRSWKARRQYWGKTLVFACSIKHADKLHALFLAGGVRSSIVHSFSEEHLGQALARFRSGSGPQVLVSVGMLLEGVDVPQARTAFISRPTTSRIVMRQMIGRVLRGEAAGGEPEANIVDLRDRWLDDIDVLAPNDVMPSDEEVVEESEQDPSASPPRPLRPVLDELTSAPLPESLLTRVRRSYEQSMQGLPHKWAMSSSALIGYFELEDVRVPVFAHAKSAWDRLVRDARTAARVPMGSSLAWFFDYLPAPRPHSSDSRAVYEFVLTQAAAPTLVPVRLSMSLSTIVGELSEAPSMTEAERSAWLLSKYESSLARTAFPTVRGFLDEVNAALLACAEGGSTGADAESPRAPRRHHVGREEPSLRPSRSLEPIRKQVIHRGRSLLRNLGEQRYLNFLYPVGQIPEVRWTREIVHSTLAYFTYQTWSKTPWRPLIQVNSALRLTKAQIPDDLLSYLVWHELCHFMSWGRGHDAEFRRLEALWPDSTRLDFELDTVQERIELWKDSR